MALDTQQEINKNFSFACVCQKKSNPENPEIAQVETSESRGRESQLLLVQFPNPHLTSESHFVNLTCGFYAPAGLQRSSEGQPAHFTVVCRDSAGDQLTRGGEHVMVSVAHREKKDWWVWLVKKGKKKAELQRSWGGLSLPPGQLLGAGRHRVHQRSPAAQKGRRCWSVWNIVWAD